MAETKKLETEFSGETQEGEKITGDFNIAVSESDDSIIEAELKIKAKIE